MVLLFFSAISLRDNFQSSLSLPPVLGHGLGKVDVDSPVVNENVVHLEVGGLAGLLVLELDKCVLQRVARFLVPYHLTPGGE